MKRISPLAILFLTLAPGVLARQSASSTPLDLQGYAAELGRWSASASRLRDHPEEAATLRRQLPDHWKVAIDEQRFVVSTKWLGDMLDRLAASPNSAIEISEEIGSRLGSMLQDSQDLAQISEPNPQLARAKLGVILRRREFRDVRTPNQMESLWDRLVDWVWRFIGKLFSHVGSHPAVASVFLWVVVVALSLIFLGWLIYSLTHLSLAPVAFRPSPAPAEGAIPPGTWQEWAGQARAAASRGEYRDAIRIIYGAAVRRIEESGTWQVDASRTHREYVRLLPKDSSQRPPLVAITTSFERVWYGSVQATSADCDVALSELESLG